MPQKKCAKNKKIKQKQSQKVNQKVIVNINTNKKNSGNNKPTIINKQLPFPFFF